MAKSTVRATIGDYAIIGDCLSAALISRDGSVDWLCWPRFDSPSIFGALLDRGCGGEFSIRPVADELHISRAYLGFSNVLETTFRCETGVVRVIDFMPIAAQPLKNRELWPDGQLVRIVECVEGEVEIEVVCRPRPEYGRVVPHLVSRGKLGFYYSHEGRSLVLRSEVPLRLSEAMSDLAGRVTLRAGERRRLALGYMRGEIAVLPALGDEADRRLRLTLDWWERWAARCTYDGLYRDAVLRSALVLKLLCYAPSGAVVAAPTTSLPERIGGVRNWDYRYCWLRDASLTVQALYDLGYTQEAAAFVSWLLHTTKITRPELQVVYDIFGESHLHERTLDHLHGFAGSRPVRVGNAAHGQFQLDVYGEVIDAVHEFVLRGGQLDRASAAMLEDWGEAICRRWDEPDNGIWEKRSERQHHTYSKAMAWVGLDRLLHLHEKCGLKVDRKKLSDIRDAIRRRVDTDGYDAGLNSYVAVFGRQEVDASLLLLDRMGYTDGDSARMRGTYDLVVTRLSANGLLYRYATQDGLPPGEGAFGICGFWAVGTLARMGELEAAHRSFQRQIDYANDLGLFSEEIDPATGELLGNFPQAFTHVGLIDAALTIKEFSGEEARPQKNRPAREEKQLL